MECDAIVAAVAGIDSTGDLLGRAMSEELAPDSQRGACARFFFTAFKLDTGDLR